MRTRQFCGICAVRRRCRRLLLHSPRRACSLLPARVAAFPLNPCSEAKQLRRDVQRLQEAEGVAVSTALTAQARLEQLQQNESRLEQAVDAHSASRKEKDAQITALQEQVEQLRCARGLAAIDGWDAEVPPPLQRRHAQERVLACCHAAARPTGAACVAQPVLAWPRPAGLHPHLHPYPHPRLLPTPFPAAGGRRRRRSARWRRLSWTQSARWAAWVATTRPRRWGMGCAEELVPAPAPGPVPGWHSARVVERAAPRQSEGSLKHACSPRPPALPQEAERLRHLAEEDRAVALAERDDALAAKAAAERQRQEVRQGLQGFGVVVWRGGALLRAWIPPINCRRFFAATLAMHAPWRPPLTPSLLTLPHASPPPPAQALEERDRFLALKGQVEQAASENEAVRAAAAQAEERRAEADAAAAAAQAAKADAENAAAAAAEAQRRAEEEEAAACAAAEAAAGQRAAAEERAEALQQETEQLQSEVEQLQGEKAQLQQALEESQAEAQQAQQELEAQLAEARSHGEALAGQLAAAEAAKAAAEAAQQAAEGRVGEMEREVAAAASDAQAAAADAQAQLEVVTADRDQLQAELRNLHQELKAAGEAADQQAQELEAAAEVGCGLRGGGQGGGLGREGARCARCWLCAVQPFLPAAGPQRPAGKAAAWQGLSPGLPPPPPLPPPLPSCCRSSGGCRLSWMPLRSARWRRSGGWMPPMRRVWPACCERA